jgi:hypothetical protein
MILHGGGSFSWRRAKPTDAEGPMVNTLLIPFWIIPPAGLHPLGFGVTAHSLADALRILRAYGYELPAQEAGLRVVPNIRVADLDQNHVVPNMGPIVVRGLWYPFCGVGVPEWLYDKS